VCEDPTRPDPSQRNGTPGKLNCWEFKKCEREPGGAKARELGVCPAAAETRVDGVHGGRNAGRACWALSSTLCGGTTQGTFTARVGSCMKCEFYRLVGRDEGSGRENSMQILARLTRSQPKRTT
jgi:hypothetical protein